LFAEPNYINKIDVNDSEPAILTTTPTSATPPMTDLQYAYNDGAGGMDVPYWNDPKKKNAEGTVVAVLDTGVDYTHEDLKGVMWDEGLKYKELTDLGGGMYGIFTAADNYDGDNIPDPRSDDPMDRSDSGHGTHCAGIIAAEWNNKGISGAANGTKIMAVNLSGDDSGSFYTSDIIEGYEYVAAAKDARVNVVAINMSYSGPTYSLTGMVCLKELGIRDIVCCNASGNESLNNDLTNRYAPLFMPVPEMLAVGAGNRNGDPCDFSNYGVRTTHIFAPGYDVMSTVPGHILCAAESKNISHPSKDKNGKELYDDFSTGTTALSYEKNNENGVELDFSEKSLIVKNISLGTGDKLTTETIKDDKPGNANPGAVLFTMKAGAPLEELPDGKRYSIIIKTEPLEKGDMRLYCYVKKKDKSWEKLCINGMSLASGDHRYCVFPFEKMDDVDLNDLTIRTYLNNSNTELKKGIEIKEIWISDEEYNYSGYNGTSMATPAVAGEVAVLAGKWPEDSGAKRAARVMAGAKPCESYKDISITGGMANVRNSLDETKYTPVISSISADEDGLSVKGYFFGDKETTDVEIRQGSRIWAVSKGSLSIKEVIPSGTDEDRILVNIPEELESNTETEVTVTDRAKPAGRQSFRRFLIPDDLKGILKEGKFYKQIRLSDTALDTLNHLMLFDGIALNGDILFPTINWDTDEANFYALGDGSFNKASDEIIIEGRCTTYNGMLLNVEGYPEHNLVLYNDGKEIKSIPFKSADKDTEELDENDLIDLYYDGKDLLMIRTRFDKPVIDPDKTVTGTTVCSLDPETGLFSSLGSLNHGYSMSRVGTGGIVISHEEREGKQNTIYVTGFANDPEKGEIFTVERFTAEKGFKPEVVSVSENFTLGEAAVDDLEINRLSGCGVKNGIYITGAYETENKDGVEYITADNYFLDYAHPEEGFKPCEKKIYDIRVYNPAVAAGYGKVYFFGMTKDGIVLSYTEADTLPHYGDRPEKEDKATRNADGSWNYSKAQNAALDLSLRSLQKSTVEGAELEMSLFAREALFFNGNKKALTDSILDKEKSVIKVNGTEVKIKKVTLKNPKKAYVSENSVFRDIIREENLAVYASFKDKKKPGYYPALDTGGLSGDTKKAVKKINKYFKKNPIPIEILPITLTGSNLKVDKYDKNKGIVKKASVTYENGSTAKLRFNASGKKDFTSKTEDGIVTITGTNNYDGKLRYDPDLGNITPVQ
nr:S8 family serine peptidase [Lachnospiraceae bacterium]